VEPLDVEHDLRRLIIRHRHVAPMVSALLASTNARVRILDADEGVILNRETGAEPEGPVQRFPIVAERHVLGWVEGGRVGAGIAAALSYACAREADKRALSEEALERYRELNLIYDLAQQIGATLEVTAVARVALDEAGRLPGGGAAFLVLDGAPDGALAGPAGVTPGPIATVRPGVGIVGAVADGEPEIVNDVAADPRATDPERAVAASLLAAPLRVRGARIGVIGAVTRVPHDYRAADLKVLAAIAALAGPAIDQARAHEAAVRIRAI
jgi:hypothetical protein